jgi:D-alanyl-D-alanine carboxypeptidase
VPTASLERTIQHFMDVGAVSVVVQIRWPGGEWSKAYGVRSVDTEDRALPQDRFSIGDITESMVAVSVLKLVDDGLIGLDDPVNPVLESFTSTLHPPGPITVRQLLNHTSGLQDFGDERDAMGTPALVANTRFSMQQGLELAAKLPWISRRVGTFSDSSSNYLALGQLIEKLRGKPLGEVLRHDIFEPLKLDGTSFAVLDREAPDNLRAYILDGKASVDVTQAEYLFGSPAEGAVSTTGDINDFYRGLLSGRLLTRTGTDEMKKTSSARNGLGLFRWRDGCSSDGFRFGHSGKVYGYLTTSISSADGGSQLTMAMSLPLLQPESEAPYVGRVVGLYASQMESAAQETLDRLCG